MMAMRRTPTTLAVASELLRSPTQPRWGYQMAGILRIDSGTVSTILTRMEQIGWLTGTWEDETDAIDRPRRHLYVVSAIGEIALKSLLDCPLGVIVMDAVYQRAANGSDV